MNNIASATKNSWWTSLRSAFLLINSAESSRIVFRGSLSEAEFDGGSTPAFLIRHNRPGCSSDLWACFQKADDTSRRDFELQRERSRGINIGNAISANKVAGFVSLLDCNTQSNFIKRLKPLPLQQLKGSLQNDITSWRLFCLDLLPTII